MVTSGFNLSTLHLHQHEFDLFPVLTRDISFCIWFRRQLPALHTKLLRMHCKNENVVSATGIYSLSQYFLVDVALLYDYCHHLAGVA